ncbi:MAG: type II toxin-antitoxin system Phd/YefM family antitoxin [Leptospirales bacterium]
MKAATISDTKNTLSALIDRVRQGEAILIMDKNRPVARLEPVTGEPAEDEGRLARLERDGLLRRSPVRALESLAGTPPPKAEKSLLAALIADRDEGRGTTAMRS